MYEPYIKKEDELTIIELVNHLIMIEEKDPVRISILDLERNSDITLTKNEIFEISQFVKENNTCCQTLEIDNILIETQPDWLTIKCSDNVVTIRPEMFDKIVKYLEESEVTIMKESNTAQNIYNSLINLSNGQNNNQTNNKPIETKTIAIKDNQTKNSKTIYDSVMDNLGGNNNGQQQ